MFTCTVTILNLKDPELRLLGGALVLFSLLRIESCAVRRFEARVQKM